jgi:succinate dehydrogenase / fumarate reductase, cytochrome b subunit
MSVRALPEVADRGTELVRGPRGSVPEQSMSQRPTSPHMTVYRMWRYSLITSILNRATGLALSVGLLLLVYWLLAVSGGEAAYDRARALLSLPLFKPLYLGLIAAFSYHLVAGLRHLVWDTGHGLERKQSRRSAWLVVVGSLVLIAVLGCWAFLVRAHAP